MQALRLVSLRISGQEAVCRLKLKDMERKYRNTKICGAGPAKKNKKTGTKHVPVFSGIRSCTPFPSELASETLKDLRTSTASFAPGGATRTSVSQMSDANIWIIFRFQKVFNNNFNTFVNKIILTGLVWFKT